MAEYADSRYCKNDDRRFNTHAGIASQFSSCQRESDRHSRIIRLSNRKRLSLFYKKLCYFLLPDNQHYRCHNGGRQNINKFCEQEHWDKKKEFYGVGNDRLFFVTQK